MSLYPKEYMDYLNHFHAKRDYFECHEIGEEYWKEKATESNKLTWLGLIQIAVSMYHWRRENYNGAYRMMKRALDSLRKESKGLDDLGINSVLFRIQLEISEQRIYQKIPYQSIRFPLEKELVELCKEKLKEEGLEWDVKSDLKDELLVHKHKLRDRRDVLAERDRSIKNKKNRRQQNQE